MLSENISLNEFDGQVTILLPVFNAEKTIARAIESVQSQSWPNWRLLIINDGSEDASAEIAQRYLYDERISIVNNKLNSGLVYSLNKGLDLINTRWIARFDADDIMLNMRLQLQLIAIKRDFPAICGSAIIRNNKLQKIRVQSDSQIKSALDFYNPINHPTVILDMQQIGQLRYPNEKCEDYCFWIILAKNGLRFKNIIEPTIVYMVSPSQKSMREKHDIPNICSDYASSKTSLESNIKHDRLRKVSHTFSQSSLRNIILEMILELLDPIYSDLSVKKLYRSRLIKSFVKRLIQSLKC